MKGNFLLIKQPLFLLYIFNLLLERIFTFQSFNSFNQALNKELNSTAQINSINNININMEKLEETMRNKPLEINENISNRKVKIETIDEDPTLADDCEIICLQPDIRLCQCSKDEINKYLTGDLAESSKHSKNASTSIMPHVYMSNKEKETCGEYSVIIRRLNIAINTNLEKFYFEPAMDFQVESPANHTVSNLFYWGDYIAFYESNPYSDYDNYIPGCIWQIPAGKKSFHSTVTVNSCRNKLMSMLGEDKKLSLCVWSYERYWNDISSGPCLCCEVNFSDCNECYKCLKNAASSSTGNEMWMDKCFVDGKEKVDFNSISCYKCLNFKSPTYNCQNYEQFLSKLISSNKFKEMAKRQKVNK